MSAKNQWAAPIEAWFTKHLRDSNDGRHGGANENFKPVEDEQGDRPPGRVIHA